MKAHWLRVESLPYGHGMKKYKDGLQPVLKWWHSKELKDQTRTHWQERESTMSIKPTAALKKRETQCTETIHRYIHSNNIMESLPVLADSQPHLNLREDQSFLVQFLETGHQIISVWSNVQFEEHNHHLLSLTQPNPSNKRKLYMQSFVLKA